MKRLIDLVKLLSIKLLILSMLGGCVSVSMLHIDELNMCLVVGEEVSKVSSCIGKVGGYDIVNINKNAIHWSWVTEQCREFNNCSSKDIAIGLAKVEDKKLQGYFSVGEPSIVARSHWSNLGGQLVMLYVFYNEGTGKVIGWVNMGSGRHRFNFTKKVIGKKGDRFN